MDNPDLKMKFETPDLNNAEQADERGLSNLNALLSAPCRFCGYNGQGYWQKDTHLLSCPWHGIGGEADRLKKLPYEIDKRIEFWNEAREIDKHHFLMYR